MTFDPTKPVQTRGGLPARIVCSDRKSTYPILALVQDREGEIAETTYGFKSDGRRGICSGESRMDLVNVPDRQVRTRHILPKAGHSGFWTGATKRPDAVGELDFITEDDVLVDVVFRKIEKGANS